MRKLILSTILLAALSPAIAQRAKKQVGVSATYAKGITAEYLKKHLYIIASDEMEGRETGKPGQHKAAEYIRNEFKRIGLQPGANGEWEQPFSLYHDTLTVSTISAGGKTFVFGQDFYNSLRESKNQEFGETEAVYAGYGLNEESYEGLDASEKIVVVKEGAPDKRKQAEAIKEKVRLASGKGARALFIISSNADQVGRYGSHIRRTGLYMSDAMSITLYTANYYFITAGMAEAIFGKSHNDIKPGDSTKGKISSLVFTKYQNEIKSSNVLGYLPGTDKKDEILFITAHYDHIGVINGKVYNGADDDGSGTVSVIAMAEAFMKAKKAGKGPRRSIMFMPVSGEEKGLLGSRYYTEHPIYPLANTVADLNIDMIGRVDDEHKSDPNYVYIIGDDKLSSDMRPINEAANKYTGLKLDYRFNDPNDPNRFYYRSDHYMFAQHKIPIIFYFNGVHEDYHGEGDESHKINYPLLAKRARLVFHTAWEIANREERPKVDRNEK